MQPQTLWTLLPSLALAIPAVLAFAGMIAPRRAALAGGAAFVLAILSALGAWSSGGAAAAAAARLGVRVDAATCVMLLLVTALGVVVVRFSQTYLDGEPGLDRYRRCLLLTLGAVTALVVANDLLVIAISWTAVSIALHQLLTFYADRPAALVAAHKKFLVSRLADGSLAVSLWLLHANVGSFDLDRIAAWVDARARLPVSMEVAAVLLALAVILRSAQLPFHGWITQVMEAPTPVSALLHAGVVNIGGFVLIRLAPWISQAAPARLLLVLVGLLSATVAALVMTTRVSVKVALAWSTCAQMGFLLLQCGLGLWPLALLHLVAHSLYKAHAFLSAGSAVEDWRRNALAPRLRPSSALRLGAAVLVAAGFGFASVDGLRSLLGQPAAPSPAAPVLALIVGLSLIPLLDAAVAGIARPIDVALRAAGIVLLYVGWHALAEQTMPASNVAASVTGWWLTGLGFLALFAVKSALELRPRSAFARLLHPWLFSGLFLDELFTRATFRVWPPRMPRQPVEPALPFRVPTAFEVQS